MKTLVVYYSRTGTTKKAAEILAKEIKAEVEEIIDKTKRGGIFGYIKSGFQANRRKLTEIEPVKNDTKRYDTVIIATPVWASNIPPPIRTYLKDNTLENKKVAILITHGGSGEEKTTDEIKKMIPKANVIGRLVIRKKEIRDAENKIREWKNSLKL